MPPSPIKFAAAELGQQLVEMSILTDSQWQTALTRAGGPEQIAVALDILTRTPAYWSEAAAAATDTGVIAPNTASATRSTALTPFQVAQIHKAEGDLARLGRLLRWNDYLLIDTLGKGGMGVVYKGWDLSNKRYVAIKRTHRESAEARKRLRREASLQKTLDHHNIAKLYSREKLGSADLLVLEYLPGSPLNDLVAKRKKENKPLPWAFVAEMGADLLDALDHAHGNNPKGVAVIHRDIKPANIMLMRTKIQGGEKYIPKLLDMGLAKWVGEKATANPSQSIGEQLTAAFQLLGTPEYMPPEQWNGGGSAVPESDTYALGGTLYFALTGELPFPAKNSGNKMQFIAVMSQLHSTAPRPSVLPLRPDVPVEFDRLIQQMLAVAPSYRGKAADLRDQLRALLAAPRTRSAAPKSGGSSARASASWGSPSSSGPSLLGGERSGGSWNTPAKEPGGSSPSLAGDRASGSSPNLGKPKSKPRIAEEPPKLTPRETSIFNLSTEELPSTDRTPSLSSAGPSGSASRNRMSSDGLSISNMSAKSVKASAERLFEDSNAGTRERKAAKDRILGFVKDTVAPHVNPAPLLIALAMVALAGWLGGVAFAVWILVMIAFAVGFAFVLTTKPTESE